MSFTFGTRSEAELEGVHPKLISVVRRALEVTQIDFAVIDGLRTVEEQNEYVRTGASKTMNSMHLRQRDGYGHAVDLVPCVFGKPRWEIPLCLQVAAAMKQAAMEQGVAITWGACWDRKLNDLPPNLARAVEDYKVRHHGTDFIDAPHFQLEAP
jgi:peptidoglycan L-alanyl-D-glutamate endopeptidase CwlK